MSGMFSEFSLGSSLMGERPALSLSVGPGAATPAAQQHTMSNSTAFAGPAASEAAQTSVALGNSVASAPEFAYDELREKMADFITQFDAFVEHGKAEIMERRQQWQKSMAEDRETQNRLRQDVEQCTSQQGELARTLEKERVEANEVQMAISEFQVMQMTAQQRNEQLRQQIEATKAEIKRKRESVAEKQRALREQGSLNQPELQFFEKALCLKVRGMTIDMIEFIFTHIHKDDHEREYSFTLDLTEREYKLASCNPTPSEFDGLMAQLNDDRDFFGFLKRARRAFVEYAKTEQASLLLA
ncbi:chromosome segregation protein Spc25-domain-containing protein [Thamnocephalis sphaerospora]|uniref:Kinetochore protein SPC25 n=1 Tax=Thamnocephalis sphaerospora TaxID=78915 RepID=A0A4P9XPY6_9FUNG|nr:chromosome segregation protein Spc25-domain-containing protein [Thamnocephalis sphaerospora]|eukprot:RKP08083.1 chromosome segregation protein Spc25-domain-containing protein [Thamnocephalis sphaerospora]